MLMKKDKNPMDGVINWKNEIGSIAGPFLPTDTKTSWLDRAARRASVSLRLITSIYYGQSKDPKYSVASKILSAAEQARIEATRREAQQLATRFAITAEGLHARDKDFYSTEINSLIDAAGLLRAMGGS